MIQFNIKDNTPEISIKISQEYFENNLVDQDANFELADGFYSRSIPESELQLAFEDDGEFKT